MRKRLFVFAALWLVVFAFCFESSAQNADSGALNAFGKEGKPLGACPLKHTDVKAEISGFLARVKVTQQFENNFSEKIEAVYTFPLSQRAAVDDMTMRVGERVVRGKIMRREEARQVYEAARNNGQVASLLDQERPNIFTQSVANILPGEKVTIEISYVETLKYEDGSYEFVFPTVVGPRYIPGAPTGQQGGGFAADTTQVPDASRITPKPAETRAGHDISIEVNLDAGVPIENIAAKSHQIESAMLSASRAGIRLKNEKEIPNRDFVLRYDVSGKKIADGILLHRAARGGFFTLILQPPDNPRAEDVTPKEIVFVLDTSGSMSGFPIEKAKESMKLALDNLYPNDTFNLITFAGDTHVLFEKPVPATRENLAKAQAFLESRRGGGGTEMMKAIQTALAPSASQQHVRIVCFMTDGYVGNDAEIIGEIQKYSNARVFSFGIGESVNRFLLDKMAETGRGEVEYVSLKDDGSAAARRFHERVRSPMMTDIEIDWAGLPVADVYPRKTQDLFSAKPVVVHGRFTSGANGTIKLKGRQNGQQIVREIPVSFPENEPNHDVLATLWARSRVDDLMSQDWSGIQSGNPKAEVKETITQLGLEFRLLTQFTSFVAVEEYVVTEGGEPRRVDVPVEMPAGVSREGVFGAPVGGIVSNQISSLPVNGRSFQSKLQISQGATATVDVSASTVEVTSQESPAIDTTSTSVTHVIRPNEEEKRAFKNQRVDAPRIENGFVIDGQEISNFRTGALNSNNEKIYGAATDLPLPEYPAQARAAKAAGEVKVEIAVDENGNVTSAKAVSGHQLLQNAAVEAAKKAKFSPVLANGIGVRLSGAIVYNFVKPEKKNGIEIRMPEPFRLSPEDKKRVMLEAKLHPTIIALARRLKDAKAQPAPEEARFVSDGKAEIRVSLADKTPEAIEELKRLGFEVVIDPKTAKFVIGRIALDKLTALAELNSVTFVAPQMK